MQTIEKHLKVNNFLMHLILVGVFIVAAGTLGSLIYMVMMTMTLNIPFTVAFSKAASIWFGSIFTGLTIALVAAMVIEYRDKIYRKRAWEELKEDKEAKEAKDLKEVK